MLRARWQRNFGFKPKGAGERFEQLGIELISKPF